MGALVTRVRPFPLRALASHKKQHSRLDIWREDFSRERTWTALTAVLEELLRLLISQCLTRGGS